jgi:hypothetical protein
MNEYVVTLTATFRAGYPVVAAQDFREWLDSQGRLSVTVTDTSTGSAVEIDA